MTIDNIDLSNLNIVLDDHTARLFDAKYHSGVPTLALEVGGMSRSLRVRSSKVHAFVGRRAPLNGKTVIVAQELRALMSGIYSPSELPSFVFPEKNSFLTKNLGHSTHFYDAERFHVDERTGFAFALNWDGCGFFWRLGDAIPNRIGVCLGHRWLGGKGRIVPTFLNFPNSVLHKRASSILKDRQARPYHRLRLYFSPLSEMCQELFSQPLDIIQRAMPLFDLALQSERANPLFEGAKSIKWCPFLPKGLRVIDQRGFGFDQELAPPPSLKSLRRRILSHLGCRLLPSAPKGDRVALMERRCRWQWACQFACHSEPGSWHDAICPLIDLERILG